MHHHHDQLWFILLYLRWAVIVGVVFIAVTLLLTMTPFGRLFRRFPRT